ncbi:MAG: hypothetical protein ABIJ92_03495 [Candidatus Aenigmatarchaeota archaeon]
MKVLKEKSVDWVEAKKILDNKAKEGELAYEQKNALEHLKKFSKTTQKNMHEMKESLEKVESLKERQIISIMNMMPKDLDELRILLANEVVSLSEDDKKKVVSIVKKFG